MPSLMESIVKLDVGAQEPWPNDVKLYQPYAMEQILLPDNANCLAVQAFLHMCGLPFQIEHRANAEFMSPSGKVPFIKCGAFVVSELEPIVQFVANKGISLTEQLTADQKSDMRAYMSIIYTVLMNAELYICWCDKKTYNEVTKVRNGSVYPWPLNHFQTWSKRSTVNRKLKVLGWYQRSIESVYQEVENCCQALSERLNGKEYFFGTKPTQVDAHLYGHIFAILSSPEYSHELITIIMKYPNLVSHCKRICTNYVYNTSLNFSELLEPMKSASKLIMNKNTCTYEIKEPNRVTAITRYLKFLNSDSDLSELTNSSSRETCKSSEENIKRTSSKTDCSIFDTQQLNTGTPSKIIEKYHSLSKSDHEYLTNLFCADKPTETQVKFVKSKEFSDFSMSSEDSVKQSKVVSKASVKSSQKNKTISNTSTISAKKSGIQEKKSSKTFLIIENDDKQISNTSLSSKISAIPKKVVSKNSSLALVNEKVHNSLFNEELGIQEKKESKKSLTVNGKVSNTSLPREEAVLQEKEVSKNYVTFVAENKEASNASVSSEIFGILEKKASRKSVTNLNEGKQSSDTSFSSVGSAKLENKVSFKSLISGNEDEKYLDVSESSEESVKNNSKKSVIPANEDRKSSIISFFNQGPGLQEKQVFKKSLASLNVDEKDLDFSISSQEFGLKVSNQSMTNAIEDKQISNISFFSHGNGIQGNQICRKYLETLDADEKYSGVSLATEEPRNKISKKSLSNGIEDKKNSNISFFSLESGMQEQKVSKKSLASAVEKYLDVSLSSERSESKVSNKILTDTTKTKQNSNSSFCSQESGLQRKKKSKKSLASIIVEGKYLDISVSSEGSGNKSSKNSLASAVEKYLDVSLYSERSESKVSNKLLIDVTKNKQNSNNSFCSQESGVQEKKNSKKSLASFLVEGKYLDISIPSEGSGNKSSKKSLISAKEDKKNSNISFSSKELEMQGKKDSRKSLESLVIDEKYLDISLYSGGSGNNVSKKPWTVVNEDKKHSNTSCLSQQSETQVKNVSNKSLVSLGVDEKYLDISLSSEGSESKSSKKSLIITNEDKKKTNISVVSQELGIEGNKVSRKSLASIDEKYLDISLYSGGSGNNVSKMHWTVVNEDKKNSNTSCGTQQSETHVTKVSNKSLVSLGVDEKYLDISLSSEGSESKSSKKSLIITNEDKKKSNISVVSQELGIQGKKVSRKSLASVDDKYLDISLSSEGSGNKVSRKSSEDLDISISSEESDNKRKIMSKKSLSVVYEDSQISNTSLSSDEYEQEKSISKESTKENKDKINDFHAYSNISLTSF